VKAITEVRTDSEFSSTPARSALASRFGWRETRKEPRLTLSAHFGEVELRRLNSHPGFHSSDWVSDTSCGTSARGWLSRCHTPSGTARQKPSRQARSRAASGRGFSSISWSVLRTAENDPRAWMKTDQLPRGGGLFRALLVVVVRTQERPVQARHLTGPSSRFRSVWGVPS
jgi:hypothetical protein